MKKNYEIWEYEDKILVKEDMAAEAKADPIKLAEFETLEEAIEFVNSYDFLNEKAETKNSWLSIEKDEEIGYVRYGYDVNSEFDYSKECYSKTNNEKIVNQKYGEEF